MFTTIRKNHPLPRWMAEEVADRLFRRLEKSPHLSHAKRVEHILEWLSRLGQGDSQPFYAFTQLNGPLKRYQFHYRLSFSKGELGLVLLPLKMRLYQLSLTKPVTQKKMSADEWEYDAVIFLLSLVPHDLYRLRRCEWCKRWLFAATRDDQKFCKRGVCRQNHYDNDPKHRERKREFMRLKRKNREPSKTRKSRLGRVGG